MKEEFPDLVAKVRAVAGDASFDLAIILGSGLGEVACLIAAIAEWSYSDCPGLLAPGVDGHVGKLVAGTIGSCRVLCFVGRSHLYEGRSAREVTAPVRAAHDLGCRKLLLTNAAGGIHPAFQAGDFMYIADHLNLLGDNPLRGETRKAFIDLTDLYQQSFFPFLAAYALDGPTRLHRGVLAACLGPSYETPSEIKALERLGADAVSMSTVPEAIMGRYLGMEIVGFCLIANRAAGLGNKSLHHREVLATANKAAGELAGLVGELLRWWHTDAKIP